MGEDKIKIGIDLDNCINYCPKFFSKFTKSISLFAEIYIITNRCPLSGDDIRLELKSFDIAYHHIVITGRKDKYIISHNITIYIDDTDEYFLNLPESVTVFKIREPGNFDFAGKKWIGSNKTTKMI